MGGVRTWGGRANRVARHMGAVGEIGRLGTWGGRANMADGRILAHMGVGKWGGFQHSIKPPLASLNHTCDLVAPRRPISPAALFVLPPSTTVLHA